MTTIANSTSATNTTEAFVARWLSMAQGDVGQEFSIAQYTDKSVQVTGVFGGASLALEGSNNGTDWDVLTDTRGNNLTFAARGVKQVTEATLKVRPNITGGDGTTNLSVHVLMKE